MPACSPSKHGMPLRIRWRPAFTRRAVTAAQIALEYGFTDVDGKQPRPLTLADV